MDLGCLTMKQVSDIINKVKNIVADTSFEAFDDTYLIEFLNQGLDLFCFETQCIQTSGTINTIASTSNYSLSSLSEQLITVYEVEFNGTPLDFAPRHEAREWSTLTSTPTAWSIWGDNLYINASPSVDQTITVFYSQLMPIFTAIGDNFGIGSMEFPRQYESAIISYIAYRCLAMNNDPNAANHKFDFDQAKAAATESVNRQLQSSGYFYA